MGLKIELQENTNKYRFINFKTVLDTSSKNGLDVIIYNKTLMNDECYDLLNINNITYSISEDGERVFISWR